MMRAALSLLVGMAAVVAAGLWAAGRLDPTRAGDAAARARVRTVELASRASESAAQLAERAAQVAHDFNEEAPTKIDEEPPAGERVQVVGESEAPEIEPAVPGGAEDGLAAQGRTGAGPHAASTGAAAAPPNPWGSNETPIPDRTASPEAPDTTDPRVSADRIRRMLAIYRRSVEASR